MPFDPMILVVILGVGAILFAWVLLRRRSAVKQVADWEGYLEMAPRTRSSTQEPVAWTGPVAGRIGGMTVWHYDETSTHRLPDRWLKVALTPAALLLRHSGVFPSGSQPLPDFRIPLEDVKGIECVAGEGRGTVRLVLPRPEGGSAALTVELVLPFNQVWQGLVARSGCEPLRES